jgi:hypothetical protein
MLAIFDMSSVNIERYNVELLKRYTDNFVAYVDDPDCCEEIAAPKAVLICSGGWSIKKIRDSFVLNGVTVLLISGQRPADFRVILAANSLNIPIVYKMHGLYVEKVKRNLSFYLVSIKKVLRTIGYLFNIAMFTKDIRISIGVLLSFVFGSSRESWMSSELNVDHCLVWSEYWKPWHQRNWGMEPRKGWAITGNPDTSKFTQIKIDEPSVCYVYQTLVEDGRVSSQSMESFYDGLASITHNLGLKVHVKWHARGEPLVREQLQSRGFIVHNELPLVKVYIGHFSSLLGLMPLLGGAIVIYELEGHVTPEPIRQCASKIVYDLNALEKALSSSCELEVRHRQQAEYYFGGQYSDNVEYEIISNYIISE